MPDAGWRHRLSRLDPSAGADRELILRLATALAGVPIIVAVILVGGEWLAAGLALVLVVGYFEFSQAMDLSHREPLVWVGAAGVASLVAVSVTRDIPTTWPLTAGVLALFATPVVDELARSRWRHEAAVPSFAEMYRRAGAAVLGLLYVGWLGSFVMLLREFPDGEEWLLLAIFAAMATDTGAFATGKLLGRHRLAPRISPNKTVEGALGGWAVGVSAVLALHLLPNIDVAYWKLVFLALVVPIMAQLGDLTASVIKRAADVKDFSRLIPGHGGLLDRMDSILFTVPIVYFFVRWVVL